jgi:hypothetical protein
MQQKTVQPLMAALCLADNITLSFRIETDSYTGEKSVVYSHDGKEMGNSICRRIRRKIHEEAERRYLSFRSEPLSAVTGSGRRTALHQYPQHRHGLGARQCLRLAVSPGQRRKW